MQSAYRTESIPTPPRAYQPVRTDEDDLIVGTSDAMRYVMSRIDQVAPTDATVLLYGETGTGKELLARAVHRRSSRRNHPFVVVNCAAMPSALMESELFGRERGAFTGAHTSQIGRFELANRGTIFLDEIGELALEVQPKLLRVLQEGQVERLGSPRTVDVDVRVIAATNRDLSEEVREGRFRRDLFYRLNVFPITVPPLRERREDIPMLVRHFAQQFARRMKKNVESIPSDTMDALKRYDWPGNIRELQNLIERAVILSTGSTLEVPIGALNGRRMASVDLPRLQTLEDADRRHIVAALERANWVIAGPNGAAVSLGIKRSTLQFRMRKLGIARPTAQQH